MSFFDHFPGSSLDSRWTAVTGGSGSSAVSDSMAVLTHTAAADTAYIYNTTKIDKSKSQIWLFCLKASVVNVSLIHFINRATAPVADTAANVVTDTRIRVATGSATPPPLQFRYYNASHTAQEWSTSWGATPRDAIAAVGTDNFHLVGFEIDATNARWRLYAGGRRQTTTVVDQGFKWSALTDWILFSNMEATDDLWLVIGDIYNNAGGGVTSVESVWMMDGTKVDAWTNSKTATSGNYNIVHHWGYKDSDNLCRFFIREDRTTNAVANAKDPFVIFDGSTYHMYFQDTSGNIGRATATSVDGTWTVQTDALANGGTTDLLSFPFVVHIPDYPDSNKIWQMLYTSLDSTASPPAAKIHLATAPAAAGTWTKQGAVIVDGGAGADDEVGATGAVALYLGNIWNVWYTGNKLHPVDSATFSQITGLRATGDDLASLTKDGVAARVPHSDSAELITASMSPSRTATVSSTSGFVVDQPVYLDQDTNTDNWAGSRVRKVNVNTSLELYHEVASFQTASSAIIIGAGAGNAQIREMIEKPAGGWIFFLTQFNFSRLQDATVYGGFQEEVGLMEHSGQYPHSSALAWNWERVPALRGAWADDRSNENISFVHTATPLNKSRKADFFIAMV